MPRTAEEQANLDFVLEMFENVLVPLDSSQVDRFVAADYIQHNQSVDTGPEPLKAFLDKVRAENPDAKQHLKNSFVDGDHVVLHYHVVPQPGKPGFAVVDIFRLENGKVAEHWDVMQEIPSEPGPNPNGPF